jgi:hypothetical protein
MECPPAPMKRRIRRCAFDEVEYIHVRYIETKVYDSGHVENITCNRVYTVNDLYGDEDVLNTTTKCSYIGRNTADKIGIHGHAIAIYDKRIRNSKSACIVPGVIFHQVILIKQ